MKQCVIRVCALVLTIAMMLGILQGNVLQSHAADSQGKEMVSSNLLTSVTLQKLVNGTYVESKEFSADDAFKMIMHFEIPANTFKANEKLAMYYQLPKSLTVQKEETGNVADNSGQIFGKYVIGTDGKVTITFNDQFNVANTYTGKLIFQGKISSNAAEGGDEQISFGKADSQITIKKKDNGNNNPNNDHGKSDSTIKKTGTVSDDHKSVTYKVTVSTKNGTGEKVNLTDSINQIENLSAEYDRKSFKVEKKDTRESSSVSFNDNQLTIKNGQKPSFTLNGLDALNAGESYELTYKMNLVESKKGDGHEMLVNGIKDQHSSTSTTTDVAKKFVAKSGQQVGNKIRWTIDVNEEGRDLSSYKLNDVLPDGYHLTEGIIVKDQNDWKEVPVLESGNEGDRQVHVNFSKVPEGLEKHRFQITYWTNTIDDVIGRETTADNTVTVENEKNTYKDQSKVGYQLEKLSKTAGQPSVEGDQLKNKWQVSLDLSGNAFDSFTYKDTLQNGVDGSGTDLGNDSHYTTTKALYDDISKSIAANRKENGDSGRNEKWQDISYKANEDYSWSLTCFDEKGQKIAANDTSTHVHSFTLEIKPNKESFKPTSMTLNYTTIGDLSNMKDKEKRTFKNKGQLVHFSADGHEKTIEVPEKHGESSYTKQSLIEKQASVNGKPDSYKNALDTKYNDLNATKDNKKELYYRILINVDKNHKGALIVDDLLPKGLSYEENSLTAVFYNNAYDIKNVNYNAKGYDFNKDPYKPEVEAVKDEKGNTKLTFTLKDGYEKDNTDQMIAIDYRAIVSDDPDWNNMKLTSKAYTNKASWDHNSTSETTTVDRKMDEISKSGEQLKDQNGDWSNSLSYTLPINPSGEDINVHGDTLTLVDTLNCPGGVSAYLDLNSVKLYSYDWSKEDKIGHEIDRSLYSFTYDEKTHQMSLEVPDEMGLVLKYNYNIDQGNVSKPMITNNAELGGRYKTSSNKNMEDQSSSSSITTSIVKIKKVDAKDYSHVLQGAVFKISKFVKNNWEDDRKSTTNANGEIELGDLKAKTLYKVEETQAPDGYVKQGKTYYVMLIGGEDNASLSDDYEQKLYNSLDQNAKDEVKGKENITFVGNEGATLLVPNTPVNLTIDKAWVDQEGKKVTPGEQSVHLNLYRAKKIASGVNVNLTIIHNQTWTETKKFTIDEGTSLTIRVSTQYDQATIKDDQGVDHSRSYEIGPFTKNTDLTIYSSSYSLNYDYTNPQPRPDYEHKEIAPGYENGLTLSSQNNWQQMIKNLPAADEQGHDYLYFVSEDGSAASGYRVSYRNNGISSGTIHVINTKDQTETQLPSTGGNGAGLFYVLGCVLVMVSMIYVIIKKKVIR